MEQSEVLTAGEDNKSVVKTYLEAARTRDVLRLGEPFDNDVVWHQPGGTSISRTYRGRGELFDLFLKLNDLSGGTFKIDSVDDVMANGDLVTAIVHYSARRKEQRISMVGVDLFRIENGKIAEVWPFSPDQYAEDQFWSH